MSSPNHKTAADAIDAAAQNPDKCASTIAATTVKTFERPPWPE